MSFLLEIVVLIKMNFGLKLLEIRISYYYQGDFELEKFKKNHDKI